MTEDSGTATGKGRPTPKRSQATRRRSGPVAPPPQTRKEAAARRKAAEKAAPRGAGGSSRQERPLLRRDAGPVRALVRDVVDRRRNAGVLLLPLALLAVLFGYVGNRAQAATWNAIFLAVVVVVVLDGVVLTLQVRKALAERYPQEPLGRHAGYGFLRSTTFRRLRMPPPRIGPGGAL